MEHLKREHNLLAHAVQGPSFALGLGVSTGASFYHLHQFTFAATAARRRTRLHHQGGCLRFTELFENNGFLDVSSHLYKRVCPSVGPSVRWLVGR